MQAQASATSLERACHQHSLHKNPWHLCEQHLDLIQLCAGRTEKPLTRLWSSCKRRRQSMAQSSAASCQSSPLSLSLYGSRTRSRSWHKHFMLPCCSVGCNVGPLYNYMLHTALCNVGKDDGFTLLYNPRVSSLREAGECENKCEPFDAISYLHC